MGCTISEADGIYALAESRYDTIKGYQKEIGEHLLELARIKDLISAKIAELESMPEPVEPAGGGGGEGIYLGKYTTFDPLEKVTYSLRRSIF